MAKKTVSADEYKNVADVAAKYVEALRVGSVEMLSNAFHNDSVTYGTVEGKIMGGAGNPTADFIHDYGKSPDINTRIDVLDITPSTAIVRVIADNDAIGSDCTEYLTFIKLKHGWTIIAKVFHQFDK